MIFVRPALKTALRGRAVVVDHGERLVAVVIDELEGVIVTPSLPHDLAGERGVVVRRAIDRFAGADTGHVVGVGDLLAATVAEASWRPFVHVKE